MNDVLYAGDKLLDAWLSLTSTLWNTRLVSTMTFNEAHVLGLLLRHRDDPTPMTATALIARTHLLNYSPADLFANVRNPPAAVFLLVSGFEDSFSVCTGLLRNYIFHECVALFPADCHPWRCRICYRNASRRQVPAHFHKAFVVDVSDFARSNLEDSSFFRFQPVLHEV